jgi:hypothetical protein
MERKRTALALGAALATVLATAPAQARHNDWGLPLIGGALGGYALGSLVSNSERRPRATTSYVEPVTQYVPVAPSTGSIEAQLRQLDQLAAGGYITPAEYKERRAEILDGL